MYETRENRIPMRDCVGNWTNGRCVTVSADERGVKRACGFGRDTGALETITGWGWVNGVQARAHLRHLLARHVHMQQPANVASVTLLYMFLRFGFASPTPCVDER